jgi:putative membrane protein
MRPWHNKRWLTARKESASMKQKQSRNSINAKSIIAIAACTLVTSTALYAQEPGSAKGGQSTPAAPGTGTAASSSAAATSSQLNRADQKFIMDAAKGGMMEVHMGKLGVQKAQNEQVKQYAQKLIDDHTKANAELKQLAATKGVTLPDDHMASSDAQKDASDRTKVRESDATDKKDKEHGAMKKLEGLSGTEFDREFVRMAVEDHQKDVKEFEKQAQKGTDAEIKAFAQRTAPTLREHLQQAQSLQSQIGSK